MDKRVLLDFRLQLEEFLCLLVQHLIKEFLVEVVPVDPVDSLDGVLCLHEPSPLHQRLRAFANESETENGVKFDRGLLSLCVYRRRKLILTLRIKLRFILVFSMCCLS